MKNIDIHIVEFGSEVYRESIELRYKVLREPLGLVYTPEQLAEESSEIHLVALSDGVVTGVLLLKKIDRDIVKMRQVAVNENCQQQGVGRQLVAFAEQYARQHHFTVMELHARDTAVGFYTKLRYQIVGDAFYEVGILHFKMVKQLN